MDTTTPTTTTTLGASPAPPSSPSSTTSYSFPRLKKIWEKKMREESAKKAAGSATTSASSSSTSSSTSATSSSSSISSPTSSTTSTSEPVVTGAKKKWRDEREAAKANPLTTSSIPPESRPVATPASRQKPGQRVNENDPMDWEDEEWDMMDTRDDYPWLGMVGPCQAEWVYEKIIFPSMTAAGIPRDPYAYPFVR